MWPAVGQDGVGDLGHGPDLLGRVRYEGGVTVESCAAVVDVVGVAGGRRESGGRSWVGLGKRVGRRG